MAHYHRTDDTDPDAITARLNIVQLTGPRYCAWLETDTPYGVEVLCGTSEAGIYDLDGHRLPVTLAWEVPDFATVPPVVRAAVEVQWTRGTAVVERCAEDL